MDAQNTSIIYGGQQGWRRISSGNLNQVKVRKYIAYPESCSTSSTVSGKEIPFVSGKSNTRIPQTAARIPAMGMEEKQKQFLKVLLFYIQCSSDKENLLRLRFKGYFLSTTGISD